MTNEIIGWHHIAIPVPDIEKSEKWYCDVLRGTVKMRMGWSDVDRRSNRSRQIWIQAGEALINLCEGPAVERQPDNHFFHYAMYSQADQLDDWISHLNSHGATVLGPYGHGGSPELSLYFDDPDGYRLEITFEFADYETAKAAAISRGGALGNPTAQYAWE